MNTKQPQRTLALWVMGIALVAVSAVLAQDKLYDLFRALPGPFQASTVEFDISHAECAKIGNNGCLSSSTPRETVGERIAIFGLGPQATLKANGWESHMLDAEIPPDRFFKLVTRR
jgi:hypothetical protein